MICRPFVLRLLQLLVAVLIVAAVSVDAAGQDHSQHGIQISAAAKTDDGLLVHGVQSSFQGGRTEIRVLLPDRLEVGKRYPVIYILPVEAANGDHYGNGLRVVKKHDLQNQFQVIFVTPTFSQVPWYADHASNPLIRQESYFIEVVVPFIDKTYPALAERRGRLLLGFSKSGWGAWSLLLRHPDLFEKAAAWDAPLNKQRPDEFEMDKIFGTQDNFEKYQITALLRQRAKSLADSTRLILMGYGNFRTHHETVHALLTDLKIPHAYQDGPQRKHEWNSGWLPEAVALLLNKADRSQ